MTRRAIVLSLAGIVFALALAVTLLRVPVRTFAIRPTGEPGVEISPDAAMKRLIRRAQIDYYVFPIKRLGHRLVFLRAVRVPPNEVYLIFWPPNISDVTVRYRCSLEDQRLLWKAAYSE